MKTKAKGRLKGHSKPARSRSAKVRTKAKASTKSTPRPVKKIAAQPATAQRLPSRPSVQQASAAAQDKQQAAYDEAMRLLYAHKFERAEPMFQKVTQGPDRTLAHHAQTHAKICAARLRQPTLHLRTAEDHYNYAVTLLNTRRLEEATRHLETAIRLAPRADHLHYTLAAAEALRGNPEAACQRLKTAIELEPQNRLRARADADFAAVLDYPPVAALLHLERPARQRQGVE